MRLAIVLLSLTFAVPGFSQSAPKVAVFESAPRGKIDGKAIAKAVAKGVTASGRTASVVAAQGGERFDKKCAEDAACRDKALAKAGGADVLFSETWVSTAQKPAAVVVEVYAVGADGVVKSAQVQDPTMAGLEKALGAQMKPLLDALAAARPAPAPAADKPAPAPAADAPAPAPAADKPAPAPAPAADKPAPAPAPAADKPAPAAVSGDDDGEDEVADDDDDDDDAVAPDDEAETKPEDTAYAEDEFEEEPVDEAPAKGSTRVWSEPDDDDDAAQKVDDRFVVEEKKPAPQTEAGFGPWAYWGWIAGFVGVGGMMAGTGVLFDLFSPTSLNNELDLGDGVGPVLVIGGAALAVVGILLNPFSLEEEGDDNG